MSNGEYYLSDAIEVIEEILAGGGEFRMYPRGKSMLPLIVEGKDSVALKRNFENSANKFDIAFYKRDDGHYVLHRVMKIKNDGTYIMCGDNQTEFEVGIRKDQIIGYVCDVYKGEKKISVRSFWYRIYVFIWSCIFLRKLHKRGGRYLTAFKKRFLKKS